MPRQPMVALRRIDPLLLTRPHPPAARLVLRFWGRLILVPMDSLLQAQRERDPMYIGMNIVLQCSLFSALLLAVFRQQ